MVCQTYPLANHHWKQAIDYIHEKDLLSHFYGEMPTPEKVKEMKEARFKGAVYRRKEKSSPAKQYKPKVTTPPFRNPPTVPESKIDIAKWWNDVKVSSYATDIIQILGKKEKLLKSIEDSQNKTHNIVEEDPLLNNSAIFEDESIKPKDMPIVLNSVDPRREDHPPFYVSILVDNIHIRHCPDDES